MLGIGIGVGAAVSIGGTMYASGQARKAEGRASREKARLTAELDELEKGRQGIINPYRNVVSLDEMIVDNSGMLSNPYENMSVATQAAEFQAEEADIALANTLDLLAATGASAGGATALAQAALQSKRNISASIEQQEVRNQEMAARGEEALMQRQMSEAQRVQMAQMSEAQRLQQADILGLEFEFGMRERRQSEQLNRKQAQITGAAQAQVAAQQSNAAILGAGIGAVGNIASSLASTA
jgi:hypothetical protein